VGAKLFIRLSDGTVAFVGTRNGRRGIFTRAKNNQLTVIADDNGPFAGFGSLALNQQGGIAFVAVRQGFGLGLFRIKNGSFVTVNSFAPNIPGVGTPGASPSTNRARLRSNLTSAQAAPSCRSARTVSSGA
jgi:hypothetical protein